MVDNAFRVLCDQRIPIKLKEIVYRMTINPTMI